MSANPTTWSLPGDFLESLAGWQGQGDPLESLRRTLEEHFAGQGLSAQSAAAGWQTFLESMQNALKQGVPLESALQDAVGQVERFAQQERLQQHNPQTDLLQGLAGGQTGQNALLQQVIDPSGQGSAASRQVVLDALAQQLSRGQGAQTAISQAQTAGDATRQTESLQNLVPTPGEQLARDLGSGAEQARQALTAYTRNLSPDESTLFVTRLQESLSRGDSPDQALRDVLDALERFRESQKQGTLPADPAHALTQALADGRHVKESSQHLLAEGARSPEEIALLFAQLQQALTQGQTTQQALQSAGQSVDQWRSQQEKSALPLSGVDQVVHALASGQGVEEALQSSGLTGNSQAVGEFVQSLQQGSSTERAQEQAIDMVHSQAQQELQSTLPLSRDGQLALALASGNQVSETLASVLPNRDLANQLMTRDGSLSETIATTAATQQSVEHWQNQAALPPSPESQLLTSLATGQGVPAGLSSGQSQALLDGIATGPVVANTSPVAPETTSTVPSVPSVASVSSSPPVAISPQTQTENMASPPTVSAGEPAVQTPVAVVQPVAPVVAALDLSVPPIESGFVQTPLLQTQVTSSAPLLSSPVVSTTATSPVVHFAPTETAFGKTGNEDVLLHFAAQEFIQHFQDMSVGAVLQSVRIVSLPGHGQLALNGGAVNAGQEFSAAELDGLTFQPDPDWNGSAGFEWLASDGVLFSTTAASVNLTILPVNEAPVLTSAATGSVAENAPVATVVYTASATDPDAGDTRSYSLGGTDAAAFGINATSGAVTLNAPADFETKAGYAITVMATDAGTLTASQAVTIAITDVNEAPVANAAPLTANEDQTTNGTLTATLSAGTPTYALVSAASHGTATLTNAATGAYSYLSNVDFNGADSFTFKVNDGTLDSNVATITVTVNAVNDAPVNTVPTAQTVNEDTNLSIAGFSIADVDDLGNAMQITLSAANGLLTLAALSGLTFASGDGVSDASMVFAGAKSAINTAIATLTYRGASNFAGTDTITLLTSDQGNTGTGGAITDTDTVTVTVNPINDAPVFSSLATQTAFEDTSKTITGLTLTDPDATTLQLTLSATLGVVTLASTTGLTFTTGDGVADASMVFSGSLADLQTALASLAYLGNANVSGSAAITLQANDLGNSGAGGALSASRTINITLTAVNDPPAGSNATLTTPENTPYTFSAANFPITDANDYNFSSVTWSRVDPDSNNASYAGAHEVQVGDVDGDGLIDLVSAANSAGDIAFYRQTSSRIFTPTIFPHGSPYANTFGYYGSDMADFNSDGKLEYISAGPNGVTTSPDNLYQFTNGAFTFVKNLYQYSNNTIALYGWDAVHLDLNKDGKMDFIWTGANHLVLAINNTVGTAAPSFVISQYMGTTAYSYKIAAGDFNHDGNMDVVHTQQGNGTVNQYFGDGVGGFSSSTSMTVGSNGYDVATGDINGDGFCDAVFGTLAGNYYVSLGSATGLQAAVNYTVAPAVASNTNLLGVALADINNDGVLDLAFSNTSAIYVLTGNNNGTFTYLNQPVVSNAGYPLYIVDVDGDGYKDFVTSVSGVGASVYFQNPGSNSLAGVVVSTLPAHGTLAVNGAPLAAGGEVTTANLGQMTYTPATNGFGTGYDAFTFQVRDNGGVANGGNNLDPTPNTTTFNVTSAGNHAPIAQAGTLMLHADQSVNGTMSASDPDGNPITWSLVTQAVHGVVTIVNAATGSYSYVPNANESGADSFTFHVSDGTLTSNTATVSVTIVPPVQVSFAAVANADVVINGSDAIQDAADFHASQFITQSVADAYAVSDGLSVGMNDNGFYAANSYHPGVQLLTTNTNDGNNVLRVGGVGSTFVDVTDDHYGYLHVFASATEGTGTFHVRLNYSDGTSVDSASITTPDWSGTLLHNTETATSYYLINAMDRWNGEMSFWEASGMQTVFGFRVTVDSTKTLTGFDLQTEGLTPLVGGVNGYLHYFGATLVPCPTGLSDPLVLDLNGDGVHLLGKEAGILFDQTGDHVADPTGWLDAGDGLLVLDRNQDGRIDGIGEVVSNWTAPGTQTSLDSLATLDDNHDGQITVQDAAYHELQVWVDRSQDGHTDPGELFSLESLGIASLHTQPEQLTSISSQGNLITATTAFTRTDGTSGTMAEVQFSYSAAMNAETDRFQYAPPQEMGSLLPEPVTFPQERMFYQATTFSQVAEMFPESLGTAPMELLHMEVSVPELFHMDSGLHASGEESIGVLLSELHVHS
ncbi:MAG: tandem-95 repeat protein [Magnetococcales bacterium]|nr:tandem-95 repeat protein [Magnetococcales bacterium]